MALQVFSKNKLWHPLDHGEKLEFKLQPGKALLEPPSLATRLNETYRYYLLAVIGAMCRMIVKSIVQAGSQNCEGCLPLICPSLMPHDGAHGMSPMRHSNGTHQHHSVGTNATSIYLLSNSWLKKWSAACY